MSKKSLLFRRIGDSSHEQDRSGVIVADQEDERVVRVERGRRRVEFGRATERNAGGSRGDGSVFVDFDERRMLHGIDPQRPGEGHVGKIRGGIERVLHAETHEDRLERNVKPGRKFRELNVNGPEIERADPSLQGFGV